MGWPFGGRRVTYVGTSVNRVVEDNLIPDIRRTSPIKAILGDQNIISTLLEDIYSGIGFKMRAFFKYAQSSEYPIGLLNYSFVKDLGNDSTSVIQGSEDFLPVVFFRHGDINITEESYRTGEDYLGSVKLLKILGLDYQELADNIHTNDQIEDVEEALLLFGVPINSTIESNKNYLYIFFDWLFENNPTLNMLQQGADEFTDAFALRIAKVPIENGISFEDKNFKLALTFGGTAIETISITNPVGSIFVNSFPFIIENEPGYTTPQGTYIEPTYIRVKTVRIVKQITSTTARVLYVGSLLATYSVYGREVEINSDFEENRLLIPINYNLVANHFSVIDRDGFYASTLHLVFNSRVTEKIPWYATDFFRGVLVVAAIVITVVSIGTAAPQAAAAVGALSVTYGVVLATVIVAMKFIVIQQALSYGFSWLADELGAEFAIILAAIAAAYGSYKGLTDPQLGTKLMTTATGLATAAENQIAMDTEQLLYEQDQFILDSEEKWAELEELEEDNFNIFDQIGLVPLMVPGESVDDFYNRTIHNTNPGVLETKIIENYVELNTRLPSFNDTIRGFKRNE